MLTVLGLFFHGSKFPSVTLNLDIFIVGQIHCISNNYGLTSHAVSSKVVVRAPYDFNLQHWPIFHPVTIF